MHKILTFPTRCSNSYTIPFLKKTIFNDSPVNLILESTEETFATHLPMTARPSDQQFASLASYVTSEIVRSSDSYQSKSSKILNKLNEVRKSAEPYDSVARIIITILKRWHSLSFPHAEKWKVTMESANISLSITKTLLVQVQPGDLVCQASFRVCHAYSSLRQSHLLSRFRPPKSRSILLTNFARAPHLSNRRRIQGFVKYLPWLAWMSYASTGIIRHLQFSMLCPKIRNVFKWM